MTLGMAKETIVRKFTNYRNKIKRSNLDTETVSQRELIDSSNSAATALIDFQKVNRGKDCFKKQMHGKIALLRDKLMSEDPSLSKVGAYQRALKMLWSEADQDVWEAKAGDEVNDVFE